MFKVGHEAKSDGSGGRVVLSERSEVRYGGRWDPTHTAALALWNRLSHVRARHHTQGSTRLLRINGHCTREPGYTNTPPASPRGRHPLAHHPGDDPEPFEDRADAIWRAED